MKNFKRDLKRIKWFGGKKLFVKTGKVIVFVGAFTVASEALSYVVVKVMAVLMNVLGAVKVRVENLLKGVA